MLQSSLFVNEQHFYLINSDDALKRGPSVDWRGAAGAGSATSPVGNLPLLKEISYKERFSYDYLLVKIKI